MYYIVLNQDLPITGIWQNDVIEIIQMSLYVFE